ncbi:integrase [Pectobacterium odoriferum]|uniref:tyrosine-type recombinase/integrase n=1 Tax=Pectobacterium TaxID=122277 RepID=UPI000CD0113A|nr:site-specific integrase [Pectobacterium odoriferum]POE07191.1 integrase [Pectobacterium odoriferum]
MVKIKVDKFILDSGERYCIVINKETAIPLYYPNLYLTTRFRNTGHAVATIESKAVNLSLFYRFLENSNINIESNILSGVYLSCGDIDRLVIYFSKVSDLRKNMNLKSDHISKRTLCHRLDSIIDYISWLTEELLQYDLSKYKVYLYTFIKSIKERKPRCHDNKYIESNHSKTLSDNAVNEIMEMIDSQSPNNPFKPMVRNRNAIIIQVLSELGIRGGELLNIKIEDINFQKKRLYIRRRADEISDSRLNQPLVKTLGRALPLSNKLAADLKSYIDCDRKFFAKDKTGFLFVTYKSGPFLGEPLSISGYHKIISKIGEECHLLKGLTGHQFRHTWNYNFSCLMDSLNVSEREQGQMLVKMMGWKEGSGTASTYNKRFVEEKAYEASIRLQDKLRRRSGEIKNDK